MHERMLRKLGVCSFYTLNHKMFELEFQKLQEKHKKTTTKPRKKYIRFSIFLIFYLSTINLKNLLQIQQLLALQVLGKRKTIRTSYIDLCTKQ